MYVPYVDKFWRGENLSILAILVRNRQIKFTSKFIFFRHRQIKSMKNLTFFTHKNIAKHSLGHFLISFSKDVITKRYLNSSK